MYFKKLREVISKKELPLHQEELYVSFQFNELRIRVEYLTESGFKVIYSDDSDFIEFLNEIYDYASLNGFDSAKEGCIISLEGTRLTILSNPSELYDSLDEDELDAFFDGDLNFRGKEFVIENVE